VSLPTHESVSFHVAMLRFPFPSQRVRALHAFVGTPYVFIVQSTKLTTQACVHVLRSFVRQVLSIKLLTHRQVLSIKLLTRTPVPYVHACFGKHIVCLVYEANAMHQTRTGVVLFPFATCRFTPYPTALRTDACSSSKRLKLHLALRRLRDSVLVGSLR
jgi:hypothetical protein